MRLLRLEDDGEFSLVEFVSNNIPHYAVLSHTWGADYEEVTFKDIVKGTGKSKAGYSKIRFCGKQAAKDDLQYFWVDTCCIDKSSSAELSEAINSMFRWYHNAAKCYVYLSDVSIGGSIGNDPLSQRPWKPAFQHSRWFTRGWTLQELVAPTCVEFFSMEGERLGDKHSMVQEIHEITGISVRALQGSPLSQFSVGERISWAASRKTKREEDAAYSLLGIFKVFMSLIYGEGRKRAFVRLQKEIKESLKDELSILPQGSGTEDDSQNRTSSLNDVFNNVIIGFRDSLGPKAKEMFKEFNSPKEMLGNLQLRCKDVRNGRKLSSLCRKIERFAAAWEPFFGIMTIFVQTHPEFAGPAWGAIHLVFILGSKHTIYLEKIVSMIQKIGESLPAYEEYFKMFMTHRKKTESEIGSAFPTEIRHRRLYKALSYVYADIIQFCQESCKIFETKRGSVHYKPSVISDLSWKPFDARFSALLDRLRYHQEVFRCEMQLEESKYLELQNEKRAHQSELGGQGLRQIQQQVKDLRLSNDQFESRIARQFDMFESKLQDREFNEGIGEEIERKEVEVINSKVSNIKEWADAPEYMREFEKAQRTRLPETGEYLLVDPVYKNWKFGKRLQHGEVSDIATPEIPRILFIKGKPGYGKTVLSSLLIEDLKDASMSSTGDLSSHGSVFFYHFASERRDFCGPYYALRAVFVQLVHIFRSHKDIIDQIAVLMESDNSGKLKASDEEIFAALSLLLEGLEHTILVFDGLDECEKHTIFLELIQELCALTSTQVLLLGRPNVELPIRFQHLSLYLHQSSNLQDIKLYLEPQILLLRERGLIPDETSLGAAVDTLALRAEGMFLWAWLMIQYLHCRALSPKERLEAIFEAADIEGLHDVYGKILRVLDQGYATERASVRKIFGLITIAFRPLLVTELQVAVAITSGKVTETSSFIVKFEESLPIICGALVEIQSDRTVQFIHSSFRDFLASTSGLAHRSSFSIDERTAHVRCSTICLSYLIYDLPSSPLCRTTSNPSVEDLKVSFPLIEYALQWVKHAASGFQASDILQKPVERNVQDDFYTVLARFISQPLTITVWIEASRIFRMKPSLKPLIALRSNQVSHLASTSPFNTGNLAVTLLEELAADLGRLDSEWGHLLKQDPSAIWGRSITAFSKSSFWFETKNTTVSSMLPAEAAGSFRSCSPQRPVLIQSQVSSVGHKLGIVLVLPSRSYLVAAESVFGVPAQSPEQNSSLLSDEEKQRLAKVCSSGWKVRYQRRNIRNEEILMDFEVDLPERQVFQMLQQCISSRNPHRFPFPVAFSHNLDRLIVLRSVLIIRRVIIPESGAVVPQCRLQSLDREVHSRPGANSSERTAFYSVFSPDAKALAFVFGRLQPSAIDCRLVQVWSEAAVDGGWPSYQCKGEVMTSRLSWRKEAVRDQFAFHPYLPLMVFTEWNTVAAWMFNDVGPMRKSTIIKQPVISLGFSRDGTSVRYSSIKPEKDTEGWTDSSSSPPPPCISDFDLESISPPRTPDYDFGSIELGENWEDSSSLLLPQRTSYYNYENDHTHLGVNVPSFRSDHNRPPGQPYVTENSIDLRWEVPSEISRLILHRGHPPRQATASTPNRNDRSADVIPSAQNEVLNHGSKRSPLQSTSSTSTLINHRTKTQQVTHKGAVIAGSQLLAHLPRLREGEETHISLLPCTENDKWVCMVWNKAAQNTYSIYDHQTPHLPSIIYRRQGTIEECSDDLQRAKRPRLE